MKTNVMVKLALFSALGVLLQLLSFPLPFFPEYLRYDAAELPALIAAFAIGPWAGVFVDFGKNLISLLIGNAPSGLIGLSANFIAGVSFVVPAGLIYERNKSKKSAVISILVGVICTTIVMAFANYFVLLPMWGVPQNAALPLITAAIVPFNLFKGILTGILTFLLYKKIRPILEIKDKK